MDLAKPCIDIGLHTNNLDAMLFFWRGEIGLEQGEVLPIRSGVKQYRHDVNGSVLKINHYKQPLSDTPPSGYAELYIARDDISAPQSFQDPDGNRVSLVPKGTYDVAQIGVRMGVRDTDAHRCFYINTLGAIETSPAVFAFGHSLLIAKHATDAPANATFEGKGWRYITIQVRKLDAEHNRILECGAREELSPVTLGKTARISMVSDPDGNWIELSQRASLTGPLD